MGVGADMFELLNSPWVTGIGGGLVSGLVVYWITQRIFSNRTAAEYRGKIDSTNRDVIYALRPGIAEGVIPERDVVEAMIHATSRKYGVYSPDAYTPATVAEELMKEVMDSSFISAKQKAAFCDALRTLNTTPAPQATSTTTRTVADTRDRPFYAGLATIMSTLLAVVAALLTAVAAFLQQPRTINHLDPFFVLVPTVIMITAVTAAATVYYVRYYVKRSRERSPDADRRASAQGD
jgi:hypothetical protein